MTIRKATKKPVTIECMQFTDHNSAQLIVQWVNAGSQGAAFNASAAFNSTFGGGLHMELATLEGNYKVSLGDWIIKGVESEFYPCKPDIFESTYDLHALSEVKE